MSLKIEVDSTHIETIKYKDKKTQADKEMRKQTLYWHKEGKKFPVEFNILIDNGEEPLPVGLYNVNTDSLIDIDRFNSLSVNGFAVYEAIKSSQFKKVA